MEPDLRAELAPHGVLRAAINLSNFLLVSGRDATGAPRGIAPDLARALADRLGLPLRLVPYPRPGPLADDAGKDLWDVGLIGAEPERAATLTFSPAYVEIEATFLVAPAAPITAIAAVDRPGVRIVSTARAAYDLWLSRNIRHAALLRAETSDAALALFRDHSLEALAGLRPRLVADAAAMPGARLLPGAFMRVQQAIGIARGKPRAARFLHHFIEEAKASGLIAQLIAQHGIEGLAVAPAAG